MRVLLGIKGEGILGGKGLLKLVFSRSLKKEL
jgi:hypothetical protein